MFTSWWDAFVLNALVLVLAVALDRLLPEPPAKIHPVVWLGRNISATERVAPQLPNVIALGKVTGTIGVNVAYSGTVVGILFLGDLARIAWAADQAKKRLSGLRVVHDSRLIGGDVIHGYPNNGRQSSVN